MLRNVDYLLANLISVFPDKSRCLLFLSLFPKSPRVHVTTFVATASLSKFTLEDPHGGSVTSHSSNMREKKKPLVSSALGRPEDRHDGQTGLN